MNSELQNLLATCIQDVSGEDKEILKGILQGFHTNSVQGIGFIGGLMQMDRKMDDHSCEITIPITPLIMNSFGIVHGGITATLIDSTMGSLSNMLAPAGKGSVTTQLNINYIAPGIGEQLKCIAQVEHKGSKTMVLSATVFRSDGKKVATGTGSFFIINND